MSDKNDVSVKGGAGLLDLLFLTSVILGVLKVAGVISLTWFQVFIPALVAIALGVTAIVIIILVVFALILFRR